LRSECPFMVGVAGIGWIGQGQYGCVRRELRRARDDMKMLQSHLRDASIFLYPVKHFGRFDSVSRMTCCAVALAMHDAGMPYSRDAKQDMGLLGTNAEGCLQSSLGYFKDYVESGRTLARGNLFIYTLPSSPLAEAAIHFGLCGPLLYMTFPEPGVDQVLRCASSMILNGETSGMVVVKGDEREALCFILVRKDEGGSDGLWNLDDVVKVAREISLFAISDRKENGES